MALKRQSFDNGAQGDTITAGNSADSGDAITTVIDANGSGVYKVAAGLVGAKGAHVTGNTGDTFQIVLANTSQTSGTAQLYFRINSYPSTGGAFFRLRSSTGNIALFVLSNTGVLSIQNSVGTGLKNFMSNTPLALNTIFRLNLRATPNASTSAGYIAGDLYSETDVLLDSYSSSAVNAGTTLNVQTTSAGKLVVGSDGFDMHIDELAFDTGTTNQINSLYPIFRRNTAEGGSSGATVTTGNSGGASGDAFSAVSLGAGTITYSNAQAHTGAYSIDISAGSGTASSIQYNYSVNLNVQQFSVSAYVYLTAYPSTGTQWLTIGNSGNAAVIAIGSNGRPFVQDGSGTANTSLTAVSLNTWLRLELTAIVGSTTSNGTIIANIYNGDSTTSPEYSYSSTARNTTTAPLTYALIGKATNSGSWATMYIDDFTVTNVGLPVPINTANSSWVLSATSTYGGRRNNFTGISSGSTITTGNSGVTSGDAFNAVTGSVVANTSANLATAYNRGMIASLSSSQNSYVSWTHADYSATGFIRCYVRRSVTHAATIRVCRGLDGSTVIWEIRWFTNGDIVLANYIAGSWISSVSGATGLDTTYRIEAKIAGLNSEIRVYLNESLTAIGATTQWGNVPDSGSWTATRFGIITASNQTMSVDLAGLAVDSAFWLGPA